MKLLSFNLILLILINVNHASILDFVSNPIKGTIDLINNQGKIFSESTKEIDKNIENLIGRPIETVQGTIDHSPDEERRAVSQLRLLLTPYK